MEVLKIGLKFKSWGEIFIGLDKGLLNLNTVIKLCDEGHIFNCNEDRMVRLCLDMDDAYYKTLDSILLFIEEDGHEKIKCQKDNDNPHPIFWDYPAMYGEIWILEELLNIVKTNDSKVEVIREVWHGVLQDYIHLYDTCGITFYHSVPNVDLPSETEKTYKLIENYIEYLKNTLKNRKY